MKLSVLIRNLNEATTLEKTIVALKKQHTNFEYEIVVVDNESEDASISIALKNNCKVFTLKRNEFTFGGSLNYGISKCKGEFILILSAHVILLNEFFLQNILRYFQNEKVGGLRFIHTAAISCDSYIFENITDLEYEDSSTFSVNNWKHFLVNHCAAIRKKAWEEVKFDDQAFASEDKIWSLEILKKGWHILYNVPCFYEYIKVTDRKAKIKRMIIEEAAKETIIGSKSILFSGSYFFLIKQRLFYNFKKSVQDFKIYSNVYKGIKSYRKHNK